MKKCCLTVRRLNRGILQASAVRPLQSWLLSLSSPLFNSFILFSPLDLRAHSLSQTQTCLPSQLSAISPLPITAHLCRLQAPSLQDHRVFQARCSHSVSTFLKATRTTKDDPQNASKGIEGDGDDEVVLMGWQTWRVNTLSTRLLVYAYQGVSDLTGCSRHL